MKFQISIMGLIHQIIFLSVCFTRTVICDILVYARNNQLIDEFRDLPAKFGPQLPPEGLKVLGIAAIPPDGCTKMDPPPPSFNDTTLNKWAVIIARSNCSFELKIRNAQQYGYDAAIVYNLNSNDLEQMSAANDEGIIIPSVFVGAKSGEYLLFNYQFENDDVLVLNDDLPFNINTHLILPFSIVVGLCFIIMLGFMIIKCLRERRRLRRHRLPKHLLKSLPVIKFNKTLQQAHLESCVICLDDYVIGDKLRVLPCKHAYHCKCIDQWLTKNRRVCPICKRKVLPRRHLRQSPQQRRSSDENTSDSDNDDTTPLINPVANSNNHGTFTQQTINEDGNYVQNSQRINPFDRSPNLPPNILQNESSNAWYTSVRNFFKWPRQHTAYNVLPENDNSINQPTTTNNASIIASIAVNLAHGSSVSNNVLNPNLNGSLNESDNDEYEEQQSTIYEPYKQTSHSLDSGHSRRMEPSPSLSSPYRLGVAAIPNTQFSPSPPDSKDYFTNKRDFIA